MTSQAKAGCLVTGVAGFVGSHLAQALLDLGHSVVGVDNYFSGHSENMEAFRDHPRFTFHEASVSEPGLLARLLKTHGDIEHVFHLAAIVSVPYSMEHELETMEVNHGAAERLLREAEQLCSGRFVFAGSAAEYGDEKRLPIKEEYANNEVVHLSPYGRAKYLASRAVAASPRGVALRFFNIYGPRQDPASPYSGVISKFASMTLGGESLTIFGDGSQSRDFIYVTDVVNAYLASAGLAPGRTAPQHGVYNIGTGTAVTVLGLARKMAGLAGNPKPISFLPARAGDILHSVSDGGKFSRASGWLPETPLEQGLHHTLDWMKASMQ